MESDNLKNSDFLLNVLEGLKPRKNISGFNMLKLVADIQEFCAISIKRLIDAPKKIRAIPLEDDRDGYDTNMPAIWIIEELVKKLGRVGLHIRCAIKVENSICLGWRFGWPYDFTEDMDRNFSIVHQCLPPGFTLIARGYEDQESRVYDSYEEAIMEAGSSDYEFIICTRMSIRELLLALSPVTIDQYSQPRVNPEREKLLALD